MQTIVCSGAAFASSIETATRDGDARANARRAQPTGPAFGRERSPRFPRNASRTRGLRGRRRSRSRRALGVSGWRSRRTIFELESLSCWLRTSMTLTSQQATETGPVSGAQRSKSCFTASSSFSLVIESKVGRCGLEIVVPGRSSRQPKRPDLSARRDAQRLMTAGSATSSFEVVPTRLLRSAVPDARPGST